MTYISNGGIDSDIENRQAVHRGKRMIFASDVMTSNVVTLSPKDSAEVAVRILLRHEISGAPVLDDDNMLVGIISEFQLLSVIYDQATNSTPVGDLMTTNVISVHEDAQLSEIADVLISRRIRRVPVVNHGRLKGLVSRRDLLRYVLNKRSSCIDKDTIVLLASPKSTKLQTATR